MVRAIAVTQRAKLYLVPGSRFHVPGSLFLFMVLAAPGCASGPQERATGVYAHDTRALIRLDYDADGDGRIDARTYMRDGKPVRLEGDGDRDGVVDRWEYYSADGSLQRVGGSSRGDGLEDTWVRTRGDERLVDISTRRDGRVDRREIYRAETLVRVESDTNHDRMTDRWEEFSDGAIARVLLDEERRLGRPTRRILYEGGQARIETDADGDGKWESTPRVAEGDIAPR
jgi:hypothetical protein